jgi:hypothetical protein
MRGVYAFDYGFYPVNPGYIFPRRAFFEGRVDAGAGDAGKKNAREVSSN